MFQVYTFNISVPLSTDLTTVDAAYIHRESDNDTIDASGEEGILTDRSRLITSATSSVRYFEYRHARYIWNASEGTFVRLHGLDKGHPINRFTTDYMYGLTKEEQTGKQTVFGLSLIHI